MKVYRMIALTVSSQVLLVSTAPVLVMTSCCYIPECAPTHINGSASWCTNATSFESNAWCQENLANCEDCAGVWVDQSPAHPPPFPPSPEHPPPRIPQLSPAPPPPSPPPPSPSLPPSPPPPPSHPPPGPVEGQCFASLAACNNLCVSNVNYTGTCWQNSDMFNSSTTMGATYGSKCTSDQYWCMVARNAFNPPKQYIGCFSDQQHCENHQQHQVAGTNCIDGAGDTTVSIPVTPEYTVYNESTNFEVWDLTGGMGCTSSDWFMTQCYSTQDACHTKCEHLLAKDIQCKCVYNTTQCGSYYYLLNGGSSNDFMAEVISGVLGAVMAAGGGYVLYSLTQGEVLPADSVASLQSFDTTYWGAGNVETIMGSFSTDSVASAEELGLIVAAA